MERIKEADLGRFQSINRGRLSPDRGRHFLFGAFVYTSLMMWIMFYMVSQEGREVFLNTFEEIVACIETILYVIQCILLLPNFFIKSAFKFQKLQATAIVFSSFQLATLPFMFIVIEGVYEVPSSGETVFYVGVLILGAIITHIVSVKKIFREAVAGRFHLEGMANSHLGKGKTLPLVMAAIAVIIIVILVASSINVDSNGTIFLVIQTVVLYGMAIGAADFVLLTYCRFKFPTFYYPWEDYIKEREIFLAYRKRESEKEKLQQKKNGEKKRKSNLKR